MTMLHVDLCWDENGRNVLLTHGARRSGRVWPFELFDLGSARIEVDALSPDVVAQLDAFGSAVMPATDEPAVVRRLVPAAPMRLRV